MTDLFRVERQGRFQDADRGQAFLTGYREAVQDDPIDKKFLKRQLKTYKKYGVPQQLSKVKGMTDAELERLAARAVLKKRGVGRKGGLDIHDLRTDFNKKRYNIPWAKKVQARKQAGLDVSKKALNKTREARQHIIRIRKNRRVMATKFWSRKGYDAYMGYLR